MRDMWWQIEPLKHPFFDFSIVGELKLLIGSRNLNTNRTELMISTVTASSDRRVHQPRAGGRREHTGTTPVWRVRFKHDSYLHDYVSNMQRMSFCEAIIQSLLRHRRHTARGVVKALRITIRRSLTKQAESLPLLRRRIRRRQDPKAVSRPRCRRDAYQHCRAGHCRAIQGRTEIDL